MLIKRSVCKKSLWKITREKRSSIRPRSTLTVSEVTLEEKEGVCKSGDQPATRLEGLELKKTRKAVSSHYSREKSTFEKAPITFSKADKTKVFEKLLLSKKM
jgi:hypothetical protein